MVCRRNIHWDIKTGNFIGQPSIMEVKSELLKKLETLFEILDQITTFEGGIGEILFFPGKNSPITENQLEFMQEFSKLLENIIA